jgi:hypothetical protein
MITRSLGKATRSLSSLSLVAMLSTACQRNPEHTIVVLAKPFAVDCAIRAAHEHGYTASHEPSATANRLARPMFGRNGDPPHEGRNGHITDYLNISEAGDSLRIIAVGSTVFGKTLAPSPRTLAHIQQIVTQCAVTP